MLGPELYELEYLFECEALKEEQQIPWRYRRVSFSLSRGHVRVEFDYEEAIGFGELRLFTEGTEIVHVALENMKEVSIQRGNGTEGLHIVFDSENYVLPLSLQTKPTIALRWGTSLELQR